MITEDQWRRLKALDARCDVFMERRSEWPATGPNGRVWLSIPGKDKESRRAWHVRITIRGSTAGPDMVDVNAPAIHDAVEGAIREAEARGWKGA